VWKLCDSGWGTCATSRSFLSICYRDACGYIRLITNSGEVFMAKIQIRHGREKYLALNRGLL
jgi:hypothetical protein